MWPLPTHVLLHEPVEGPLLTFGEVFDQRAFRLPLFVMTSRGQPEAPQQARIAERNAPLRRRLFRESVGWASATIWNSRSRAIVSSFASAFW